MFTRENKPLFWQKWTPDIFFLFPAAMLVPMYMGTNILISINLCETLCQITRVWNTAQTWGLDRVLTYLSSIACKFLDFIHWMVFDFYFDGVTVKTGNNSSFPAVLRNVVKSIDIFYVGPRRKVQTHCNFWRFWLFKEARINAPAWRFFLFARNILVTKQQWPFHSFSAICRLIDTLTFSFPSLFYCRSRRLCKSFKPYDFLRVLVL